MKHTSALWTLAALLVLASCTKEKSVDSTDPNGGGSGGGAGTRLSRMVSKDGQDSSVTLFTYGGGGKLASFIGTAQADGQTVEVEQRVERNAAGIITRIILKSDAFAVFGIDSLISRVNYSASQGRYTSRVTSIEIQGFMLSDSTAFAYDGSGKIISAVSYADDGFGYAESSKVEYGYAANNLTSEQASEINPDNGQYEALQTVTYGYDTKKAALELGTEAIIMGISQYYSANNITSLAVTDPSDPANNDAITVVYEYNANNQPVSATITSQASGATTTTTYSYK